MSQNLRVLCVQTGLEWDFTDDFPPCTEGGHVHEPIELNGRVLDLNERMADTPQ